jgi:CRP-like cAMP-binding protein
MMRESSLAGHEEYFENLRRMAGFASFEDEDLRRILDSGRLRRYEPGEDVIREGEREAWMYFIISGRVSVLKEGRSVGRIAGTGEIFGEIGIIDGQPRSATVRAEDKTLVLAVDGSFLNAVPDEHRAACYSVLYRMFAQVLAERLRETSEDLARAKEAVARLRGLAGEAAPA